LFGDLIAQNARKLKYVKLGSNVRNQISKTASGLRPEALVSSEELLA